MTYRAMFLPATLMLGAAMLAGCGLPIAGPRGEDIERTAAVTADVKGPKQVPYCLVHVNQTAVDTAIAHRYRFSGHLTGGRTKRGANIGVGDIISVTLFEASAGGLFFPLEGGSRQGNFITLPNQSVDDRGSISIPYAGSIRASGRSVTEIQRAIVQALSIKALEPQVVVSIVERRADLISVLGEVGAPTRIAASAAGERLIDVLARAGGVRSAPSDSWVQVERGGRIQTIPFEAVMRRPENNIAIVAQDTVYVYRKPQTFLAFGATGIKGVVPFENHSLSVAEGLAKAGGLIDTQAEPGWVFIYRFETAHSVEHIDPNCRLNDNGLVPTIYRFDLRDPSGMFLASQFPLQNRDVLFAANARTVEQTKFFNYIQEINQTIRAPMDTTITGYTLRNLANGGANGVVVINPAQGN
jgi:polysaccharide biosynthesis/export protein